MEGTTSREKEAAEYGGRGGGKRKGREREREIALAARKSGGGGKRTSFTHFPSNGREEEEGGEKEEGKHRVHERGKNSPGNLSATDESRGGGKNQFQHLISNRGRIAASTCALKGLLWEDDVVRTLCTVLTGAGKEMESFL